VKPANKAGQYYCNGIPDWSQPAPQLRDRRCPSPSRRSGHDVRDATAGRGHDDAAFRTSARMAAAIGKHREAVGAGGHGRTANAPALTARATSSVLDRAAHRRMADSNWCRTVCTLTASEFAIARSACPQAARAITASSASVRCAAWQAHPEGPLPAPAPDAEGSGAGRPPSWLLPVPLLPTMLPPLPVVIPPMAARAPPPTH
jgi:hypothetical protein